MKVKIQSNVLNVAIDSANNIIDEAQKLNKELVVSYSGGKDSLVMLDLVAKRLNDFKIAIFYHYPDCYFTNKAIEYVKNKYNLPMIKLPHPCLYDRLRNQILCTPKQVVHLSQFNIPKYTFKDLIEIILGHDNFYFFVGMKKSDSYNRRLILTKYGAFQHKKHNIYPLADFTKNLILAYMQLKKIELPCDYKYFHSSFDGFWGEYLIPIKFHLPEEWQKIKNLFPLVDMEVKRYELK